MKDWTMPTETLINDSIVARLDIDVALRDNHGDTGEYDAICAGLAAICDPRRKDEFEVFGRPHRIIFPTPGSEGTFWRPPIAGGRGEAQILLRSVDEPAQRV